MKINLKANELVGTDVNIVSMVKRGANRIPFRIVKEDNEEMLDLHKIGRQAFAKSEPKKGGVLAVIVNKSADIEAIKTALADTGFTFEKGEEGDDAIVFKQEGVDEHDVGMIKLDDDVVLAVSGLKKGFSSYDWESTDFATVFATEGFYPNLRVATEAFSCTVSNILYKGDNKSDISTKVSKALTDFSQLVNALVNTIPESAVKADEALKSEEYLKGAGKKKMPVAEEAEDDKAKAKKEEDKVEETAKSEDTTEEAPVEKTEDKTEEAPAETQKSEAAPAAFDMDALLSKMGEMVSTKINEALEPVVASTDALKGELDAISTRVESVATSATKAEQAVRTTVIASSTGDRTVSTKKSDASVAPPLLDTAYGRSK